MNSPKKIFAIIPARGGSKGVLRKNLRLLAGKPLISYSISAGLHCDIVNRVIVSTEDSEIKNVSLSLGAEVIDRPQYLALENSLTRDVVLHTLEQLKKSSELPQYFVLLQPTSPLRNAFHLKACLDLFFKSSCDCALSVTEAEHHPYKFFLYKSCTLFPLFGSEYLDKPRQMLPPIYRQNGAIYVLKTDAFLAKKSFYFEPCLPFLMNSTFSVDVDTEFDFQVAEILLSKNVKQINY